MNSGDLKSFLAFRRTAVACLLLGLITLSVFWPVARLGFTGYDDPAYVTNNSQVQTGLTWQGLAWAFGRLHGEHTYWHPLTWISHMVDCQIFGLNPVGHHLVNLLVHSLNTILVFLVFRRLTGAFWRCVVLAALFGLHPLQVDTVAWVAERKNLLSAFLFLLTIWAYARYAEVSTLKSRVQSRKSKVRCPTSNVRGQRSGVRGQEVSWSTFDVRSSIFDGRPSSFRVWYWVALAMFVCGLMCKPMLVTLPFVLLLLDYWPLGRFQLKTQDSRLRTSLPLLWEKLPFLALSAISMLITLAAHHALRLVMDGGSRFPLEGRAANALVSYVRYLGKTIWPTSLAVFYPRPPTWPISIVVGCALLLLAISGLAILGARRRPYLFVGWFWFLGVLVPFIGLVQAGAQAMADRFAYVPLIGLFIMLVWGAHDLAVRIIYNHRWTQIDTDEDCSRPRFSVVPDADPKQSEPRQESGPQHLRSSGSICGSLVRGYGLAAVALAAAVVSIGLTRRQIGYWKDNESLWRHALAVTQDNAIAQYNLGVALSIKGDLDEAIRHFEAALRRSTGKGEIHRALAQALVRKRRFAEAFQQFEESLRLNPGDAAAHNDLGNLLGRLGKAQEAIAHLREAVRLAPGLPEGHYNLALGLANLGSYAEAAAQFQEVLRLKPGSVDAQQKLQQMLMAQAKSEQAIAQCRAALAARPGDARAHSDLGRALIQGGQFDEGMKQLAEAGRLDPANAAIPYQIGLALFRQGDPEKAAEQFRRALQLDPKDASAQYGLGRVDLQQGNVAEALAHWREATRLSPGSVAPLLDSAWIMATDPEPGLRNGPEAIKLASRAAELTGHGNVRVLDTLAAAYAEAGRFAQASATAREAEATAAARSQAELAAQIRERLALYDARQPYREEPEAK